MLKGRSKKSKNTSAKEEGKRWEIVVPHFKKLFLITDSLFLDLFVHHLFLFVQKKIKEKLLFFICIWQYYIKYLENLLELLILQIIVLTSLILCGVEYFIGLYCAAIFSCNASCNSLIKVTFLWVFILFVSWIKVYRYKIFFLFKFSFWKCVNSNNFYYYLVQVKYLSFSICSFILC